MGGGTGNGIDDITGLDEGLGIGTGDSLELAEEPGIGTGDGSRLDKGSANCVGLYDRWSDSMLA